MRWILAKGRYACHIFSSQRIEAGAFDLAALLGPNRTRSPQVSSRVGGGVSKKALKRLERAARRGNDLVIGANANGRNSRIRTCDLLVPNETRYRACSAIDY